MTGAGPNLTKTVPYLPLHTPSLTLLLYVRYKYSTLLNDVRACFGTGSMIPKLLLSSQVKSQCYVLALLGPQC